MMEKVSVIIPIYQVEKYITRCVNSVINQTYANIEIICVDDCGTDHSSQIVEQMRKRYPERLRVLYGEKNVGAGKARDKGLCAAQGEFIAFLDGDDYYEEDFIEKYVEAMGEQVDMVVGNCTWETIKGRHTFPVDERDETFPWTSVSACTKLFRRSFLEKYQIDFAGVCHYEDVIFTYKALLKKPAIRIIDYAGYHYCIHEESQTQSRKRGRSDLAEEYFVNMQVFLDSLEEDIKRNTMFGYCMISHLIVNLLYNGRGAGIKKMKELYRMYKDLSDRVRAECYCGAKVRACVLKAESWKQKYSTWLILHLQNIKCDRILFLLVSLL